MRFVAAATPATDASTVTETTAPTSALFHVRPARTTGV
jgi:hypothetical protein